MTVSTGKTRARQRESKARAFRAALYSDTPTPIDRRAEKRREYRASPAFDHGSAAAARKRHLSTKAGKPRRKSVPGMPSIVPDVSHLATRRKQKAELRKWAHARIREQQTAACGALVSRGVPLAQAQRQFGSI